MRSENGVNEAGGAGVNNAPALSSSVVGLQFKRIEDFYHVIPSLNISKHRGRKGFLAVIFVIALSFVASSIVGYDSFTTQEENIEEGF